MARKPIDYWEKRSTELMQRIEKGTEKTINSLIKAYEQATKDINKEITKIFRNYAKDTGLKKETLLQLLNKKETEQYYNNLLEVINNNITNESIKKKLLAKYNAPAYSYRISRYESLQQNIDIELKKLANIEQQITEIRYVDTIKEGYYHNIFDIQKGIGIGFSFAQIDNRTINLLLNENWIDNANFSKRIWDNSEKLGNYIRTNLTAATMSGKSINKIAQELADYMNVGIYSATRLVRTEVNHFANEAEMLAYEELDIEKYRFIATLDNRTCEHCAELDNKVFNVKDRKAGKNYPPLHANDRCTTVAEFDDDVLDRLQRRARNPVTGENEVIDNISYKEWAKKNGLIEDNKNSTNKSKDDTITPHKISNGKNLVGKFDITEDEKYNDGGIGRIVKLQGYDGIPKLVNDKDFEKYCKESNFFAQRTYGGKTKEQVYDYQEQLYKGDWYIDALVGGSQYGKGMYCAGVYDLNDEKGINGIVEEMKHYQSLNKMRKNPYSITEDITLDKSARVIKYNDIVPTYIKELGKINNWSNEEFSIYNDYHDKINKYNTAYQNYIANWRQGTNIQSYLDDYYKYKKEAESVRKQFTNKMNSTYTNSIKDKDISTLAVEMGYDVINAEGHGQSGSYTVILNRTKVIIRKGGRYYE